MSNEKLIREALGFIEGSDPESARTTLIRDLVAALQEGAPADDEPGWAPGEKHADCYHGEHSCTPTGDERELAQVIKDFWWECEAGQKPPKHLSGVPSAGDVALASSILTAGFRHSEVPQPSADQCAATPDKFLDHPECYPCNLMDGHPGDHWSNKPVGTPGISWRPEPQGEPSDAQALLTIRDDIVRNGGRADAAVLAGLERLASRAAGGAR